MTVAILGRTKWEWGKGDVVVIRVGDLFFAQCEERDDCDEAEVIDPQLAMDVLTRRGAKLTHAGQLWMKEQRELQARYLARKAKV